jgi:hypothetical protein
MLYPEACDALVTSPFTWAIGALALIGAIYLVAYLGTITDMLVTYAMKGK